MNQRIYIDINSGIGRMNSREERIPYKVETLLNDMKYYRVHASLVYSNVARDYAFTKGNDELIQNIKNHGRLFGIATVIPNIQYEIEGNYGYFNKLVKNGINAFKMYPETLRHGFDPFFLEESAKFMIDKCIPLFVDVDEIGWRNLRECLEAFRMLKIVLCNVSWGHNRYLFPLMDRFDNLYFDISSNQANDILQICKKHFGINRVLFGSNYPYKVIGGLKALVEYSGLDDDYKDMIAYKNAATLFKIDYNSIMKYEEDDCMLDEIAIRVDTGKPLNDVLVIDSHAHIVDSRHKTVSFSIMLNSDEHNVIKKMDLLGIDKIITSPWEGIMTNGISANETLARACNRYGDRINAYATYNPNYKEDMDAVIAVYHKKYRFIGIKPYWPTHKYDLMDERYREWFEYGNKNGLIMLVHSGDEEVARKVKTLSEKYWNMTFILAHSGSSYKSARYNIEAAKSCSNIYLEITYTSITNGMIEYLVEEIGADKVLFGSDLPMRDPAPQLAWVAYSKISVEAKKKILGINISSIMNRCYKGTVL